MRASGWLVKLLRPATAGEGLKTELKKEFSDVGTEIAELRTELKSEIAGARGEVKSEIAGVGTEIAELRSELKTGIDSVIRRMIGCG
jgi:hypothetical protein